MKTIIITLQILLIFSLVCNLILFLLHKRLWQNLVDDYKDGKHYCNYCKKGFINTKEDRAKTNCDYCGKPLTLHMEHPSFQEESIEQNNNLQPFEEFNKIDKDGE